MKFKYIVKCDNGDGEKIIGKAINMEQVYAIMAYVMHQGYDIIWYEEIKL